MRRWILACVLILIPIHAQADPDIGCGPGTQIWEGSTGVAPKVLGATTNGTTGLQTFGITFGTLGCNQGGTVTAEARLRMFTDANLDQLARDMAHGEGETLEAFAELWGVEESDRPAFYHLTQTRFGALFAGDEVRSDQVLASLQTLLAEDEQLAAYAEI